MPSLTVENYLKAILQITIRSGRNTVSTGRLAEEMGVLPGTVTSMLKTLSESELAIYKPYEGVVLTKQGNALAMRMLRRHRLIELFLSKTLGLEWDQVHEEAENMEHAVSDFVIDRIDDFLGKPKTDPHGDPIPSAEGEMRTSTEEASSLTACPAGSEVRFIRVLDQDSDFLKQLSASGVLLGETGKVTSHDDDSIKVNLDSTSESISLPHAWSDHVLVEVTSPASSDVANE